jgi:molybdopterin-guanine dinucleotide biosynthesis protein A
MRIAGILLAGGRSTRMGADKMRMRFAGRTLLEHSAQRLRPQVAALAVSANAPLDLPALDDLPLLPDPLPDYPGPLAGILAGFDWAASLEGVTHLASAAGDTPFIPQDLVARLASAVEADPARIAIAASSGNRHPTCALWPLSLREGLWQYLQAHESLKVGAFIDRHDAVRVAFAPQKSHAGDFDPFFNVNTPADLARAEEIAIGAAQ